jgi:riboflavin synthase
MFTGIIEEVGRIARIDQNGENRRIVIEAKNVTKDLKTGDSCAVSGRRGYALRSPASIPARK